MRTSSWRKELGRYGNRRTFYCPKVYHRQFSQIQELKTEKCCNGSAIFIIFANIMAIKIKSIVLNQYESYRYSLPSL